MSHKLFSCLPGRKMATNSGKKYLLKIIALRQKFSEVSVDLCEEMGFQPSPKLSTTDG